MSQLSIPNMFPINYQHGTVRCLLEQNKEKVKVSHNCPQLIYKVNTTECHHQQAATFWRLAWPTLLCGLKQKAADSISVPHQLQLDVEAVYEFHCSLCSVIYHWQTFDVFLVEREIFKGLPSIWILVCGQVCFQCKCVNE